jgi:nitroreductase
MLRPAARVVKRVKTSLELRWMAWAARGPRRAALYCYLHGVFDREAYAVLNGKVAQTVGRGELGERARRYRFRQWLHGLEKGLTMWPRRNTFALTYIREAVDLFERFAVRGENAAQGDLLLTQWARDVLTRYFDAVDDEPAVERARVKFRAIAARLGGEMRATGPYKRDLTPTSVSHQDLLALAQRRRSVRWYLPKAVPREVIDDAIRIAGYSPTGCNRQPFEFRIYDDPALVREIAGIPLGGLGFAEQVPCIAVLIGDASAFRHERDRHMMYIDAALATMAFHFALEVQGVSACILNWPEIAEKERQLAERMSLQPSERPVLLLSLGYPDPERLVAWSQKKSLDELRSYNKT